MLLCYKIKFLFEICAGFRILILKRTGINEIVLKRSQKKTDTCYNSLKDLHSEIVRIFMCLE